MNCLHQTIRQLIKLMIDSSCLSSPSLRLCNLTDPEFVCRQCSPFSSQAISNEDFDIQFVEETIVPEIKNAIKQDKKSKFETLPTLFRLIIDNFPQDGSNIVKNKIFPAIQSTIKFGGARKTSDLTKLAVEIASVIPRYYRDDIISDLVMRYYLDEDPSTRNLAVHLISIVRDFWRVQPILEILSKDKSNLVRASVLMILPNCMCDEDTVRTIISQAVSDSNPGIQQIAASIIGKVAPWMIDEFKGLLESVTTVRYAFPSLPEVISQNSFAQIIDSFFEATKIDKNDAAVALLEAVQVADINTEEALYIRAASELITFTPFAWRLHAFSLNFTNKNDFVELLDPSNIKDWRTRYALLKQCEEFVPELGSQLVRLAEIYSEDETAVIRKESASLWALLVQSDSSLDSDMIERLMRGPWQKRIVLCKVIKQFGTSRFARVAEKLKKDDVAMVRDCITDF